MKKNKTAFFTAISITAIAICTAFLPFSAKFDAAATTVAVEERSFSPAFEEDEPLEAVGENKENGAVATFGEISIIKSAENNTAQEDGWIIGDVNHDGRINVKDATKIQMILANFAETNDEINAVADVNCDKKVNIFDATMIQKYCAGLIGDFEISQPTTEETTLPSENADNLPPKAPKQDGEWGVYVNN